MQKTSVNKTAEDITELKRQYKQVSVIAKQAKKKAEAAQAWAVATITVTICVCFMLWLVLLGITIVHERRITADYEKFKDGVLLLTWEQTQAITDLKMITKDSNWLEWQKMTLDQLLKQREVQERDLKKQKEWEKENERKAKLRGKGRSNRNSGIPKSNSKRFDNTD